jgi:hypothetical protein
MLMGIEIELDKLGWMILDFQIGMMLKLNLS